MKEAIATGNKTRTQADADLKALVESELSNGAIAIVAGASVLLGLWAVACFFGGALTSGPLAMLKSWFSAVSGM